MSSVLVTGGAGYIGSHLCKLLHQNQITPIIYDSFVTSNPSLPRYGTLIEGDIHNTPLLLDTLHTFQIQAVFHLAALSQARESILFPHKYYQTNVLGTRALLTALKNYAPIPLIFASSGSVYQQTTASILEETAPLGALHPYGISKQLAEKAILSFAWETKTPCAILRYFNIAGADLEGKIGEAHHPETHLIPLLIEKALSPSSPFSLFSHSHPTPDGTAIRDFLHVEDLVRAHLLTWQFLDKHTTPLIVNLGSGTGYSVLEILTSIEKKLHTTIPIHYAPPQKEASTLLASTGKARSILHFTPKYSDLDTILETAIAWHRNKILAYGL